MKIGGSDCGEENNSYLSEQNKANSLVYIYEREKSCQENRSLSYNRTSRQNERKMSVLGLENEL